MQRSLRRMLSWPLLAMLAIALAYEEVQWRLSAVFALLGKLPVLHQLENWARRLPPYGALALFGVPTAILLPMKLLAVFWLTAGHRLLGLATIFAAKIIGTALVARIFQLTRDALLTIGWCRWTYDKIIALRAAAYGIWRAMPLVRWWRARWARMKAAPPGKWGRRWHAFRQRFKRD